jgi:four helix bundle protein
MNNSNEKYKQYDLEDRTLIFARRVRKFLRMLKISVYNIDDFKQLIRSSGSVGANYIEANERLGKRDFLMRIKICKKEAKESRYWLKLIDVSGDDMKKERNYLLDESTQLMNIFGSILAKSQNLR